MRLVKNFMASRKTCDVMTAASSPIRVLAVTLVMLRYVSLVKCQLTGPMTCSTTGSSCPAYLYYKLRYSDTPASVANLFSVSQDSIMQEDTNLKTGGAIISLQCLCSESLTYLAEAAYLVASGDTQMSVVTGQYESLARMTTTGKGLVDGELFQIHLFCGCIGSLGQPLLTYIVQKEDTLERLAIRFNTSTTTIMSINNMNAEQDHPLSSQMPYYIPIDEYALQPVVVLPHVASDIPGGSGRFAFGRIVGIVLAALLFIAAVAALVFFLQRRELCCYKKRKRDIDSRSPSNNSYDVPVPSGRAVSQRPSGGVLESLVQCGPWNHDVSSLNVKHHVSSSLSKEKRNFAIGAENPKVFGYDEVKSATSDFQASNRIGSGTYGAVYFGLLRGQEVTVKKMKATKTDECLAELRTVCKVRHTNLVELIGYSIKEDDLFLVYEYAENRSVRDRLHNPHMKGFTPLTWNARVQIALDAARGLGCIHDHLTGHYVHRDVNTGSILLDGSLKAKVADFGLAKLAEQSSEKEVAATRSFGTVGYLAPECVRDSQATAKSDVYAFGVVLFELITGKGAVLVGNTSRSESRSLASLMLSALGDYKLKAIVDPLLQDIYPLDSVSRMATVGQNCVEEDPQDRPDMKLVVQTLNQILLASIKWDATRPGNSEVSNRRI